MPRRSAVSPPAAPAMPARPPLSFLSPIHRASRQIARYLEAAVMPLGLSTQEGHCLSYLLSYAPCTVGDLVRVFGHKPSTLTSMLDRLERAGHIKRKMNPADRRSLIVHLSVKGSRVATRMRADVDALEAAIRAELGEQELAGFRAVMAAIQRVTASKGTEAKAASNRAASDVGPSNKE